MKKTIYSIMMLTGISITATSCAKDELRETTESITTEVKAEIVDGETTVNIVTDENGKESVEVLTGDDAKKYLEDNDKFKMSDIDDMNSDVIIKKISSELELDIDIDEILDDPELKNLDEVTKSKIKTALENNLNDIDFKEHAGEDGTEEMKTKVMVIEE